MKGLLWIAGLAGAVAVVVLVLMIFVINLLVRFLTRDRSARVV